ncbi:MAG: hypothetical protein IJ346_00305 [Clostridia bacterium]|nr:hypothetical protein [Clostridia bacterium]
MNAEKRIRNEARSILSKGNWSKALGIFFILFVSVLLVLFFQGVLVLGIQVVLTPLFNVLSEVSSDFSLEVEDSLGSSLLLIIQSTFGYLAYAVGFIFLFPLYCGVRRYFYLTSKGKDTNINDVFYYLTQNFKKSLLLGLRYGLICILKLLPCIAPAYLIATAMTTNEFGTLANSLLTLCVIITGVAGISLWILWTSRQSLSMYLFIEDDTKPSGFYVKESERITAGPLNNSMRKLMFSFAGWFLLALTGVGMLYFVPYFEMSVATSAKWIIKLQKEDCLL